MRASFWTIYKRGRFSSHGLSEKERMQQRERFGVACLALCLQRDKEFCDEFARDICNVPSSRGGWHVDVDPYRERSAAWADILLRAPQSSIVIECKVHDDLEPEQDPWRNRNDFMIEGRGYGWCFRREFEHTRRTYVALTESRTDQPKIVSGTACRTATWAKLRGLSKPSEWVKDLFLSLANLDYPAFRSMKTENLHIDNVEETLACHEVLTSIALRLGLRDWKIDHSADEVDENHGEIINGHIGVEITGFRTIQRNKEQIKRTIHATTNYQAWFGYNLEPSPDGSTTNLSIWFYCGNQNSAKEVKKRVGRIEGWRIVLMKKDVKKGEKYFLQYCKPATCGKHDENQFMQLLTRVIPEVGTAK